VASGSTWRQSASLFLTRAFRTSGRALCARTHVGFGFGFGFEGGRLLRPPLLGSVCRAELQVAQLSTTNGVAATITTNGVAATIAQSGTLRHFAMRRTHE